MGCSGPTSATTNKDKQPWSPAYDADWRAALLCWQKELGKKHEPPKPNVTVRDDCKTHKSGIQYFKTDTSSTGWATGTTDGMDVEVCPDLKALRHELSHYIRWRFTGEYGTNGSKKCDL